MKTLHIDTPCGMAGDMFIGALLDAGLPFSFLQTELGKLGLHGYALTAERVNKCGVTATKFSVIVDKDATQPHRHYSDIAKMITESQLSAALKKRSLALFECIAVAEGAVHGVPKEKVHFHEVGALDSLVDMVGAAIGLEWLGVAAISASAVNVGSGNAKTDHGIYPIPAPATAEILKGVPTYAAGPAKELTTPTGAAILKVVATQFGPQPPMVVTTIGVGAGSYDFDARPNVVRLFIGEGEGEGALITEQLVELTSAIDDMNPEQYSYVVDKLFAASALDVTLVPIQMKKGRPGVALTVLCKPCDADELQNNIFLETTSLGLRRSLVSRLSLPRRIVTVATPHGEVRVKVATLPDGSERVMPEYESVREVAERQKVTFDTVYRGALP